MTQLIQNEFLQPGSAHRLGISRTLFYGLYLMQLWLIDPTPYGEVPAEFWKPPLLLTSFPAPTPDLFFAVTVLLKIALIFSAVGFLSRCSSIIVALTGTFIYGVASGYGYQDFRLSPVVLISWILAVAPIGDAFSADSWLRQKPIQRNRVDYYWPIRLAQIVLVALMCTAGLRKIQGDWLANPAGCMKSFIMYKFYAQVNEKVDVLPQYVLTIAENHWLLTLSAIVVVICEFGSPLAIPRRWMCIRGIMIGGLFAMQLVLAVVFKTLPTFPWLAAYVFWVPWEVLMRRPENRPELD